MPVAQYWCFLQPSVPPLCLAGNGPAISTVTRHLVSLALETAEDHAIPRLPASHVAEAIRQLHQAVQLSGLSQLMDGKLSQRF